MLERRMYIKKLTTDASAVMAELYARVPGPYSHLVHYTLGGAVSRVSDQQTAVAYRDTSYVAIAVGMWENRAEHDMNIQWVPESVEALQPFASGGFYRNYEENAAADRLMAAFGTDRYDRLSEVKSKYDPENISYLNQNIEPAAV